MTKKQGGDDVGPRNIPPGSCSWCGHPPHPAACSSTIRVDQGEHSPCPCSKRATP